VFLKKIEETYGEFKDDASRGITRALRDSTAEAHEI
jgi:hypothetical protein